MIVDTHHFEFKSEFCVLRGVWVICQPAEVKYKGGTAIFEQRTGATQIIQIYSNIFLFLKLKPSLQLDYSFVFH